MEEQILKLFKNYPSDFKDGSFEYRFSRRHEDEAYVLLKCIFQPFPKCGMCSFKRKKFPIVVKASEDLVYITRLFEYLTGVSPI